MENKNASPNIEEAEVISLVQQIISKEGRTQSQIARESNMSATTLSQLLQGSYQGDRLANVDKLKKWLVAQSRQQKYVKVLLESRSWAETQTSQNIWAVIDYARMASDMALVYGGAGLGKSCTLARYCHENQNAWLATMSPPFGSPLAALEQTALALDMKDFPSGPAPLLREIISRTARTKGVLLIDEAQHLRPAAVEAIRSIHDAAGIGLVFVGNTTVYGRLTGGRQSEIFAQVFSRVGRTLRLTRPLKEDVRAVTELFGVTGAKEVKVLFNLSQRPGGLRSVVKTLRLAMLAMVGDGKAIDLDRILAAWSDLTGEPYSG